MNDILSDKDKVKAVIEMFESRVATLEQQKAKLQSQIDQIQAKINDCQEKIPILREYYEFLDLVGFSTIKQIVEAHAEEIKHAREELLKEEPEGDNSGTYTLHEPIFTQEGFSFRFS